MAREILESLGSVKITRNFPITKIHKERKFTSHFKPSTRETTYDSERRKIVIQWFDGFAIEYVNTTKQRYKITDMEYDQLFERYYPTPDILEQAMLAAYLKEVEQCGGVVYYTKQFTEAALTIPGSTLQNVSKAYVKHKHANLNIDQKEAYLWHCIASICREAYDEDPYQGIAGSISYDSPEILLNRRIKELRSDGYNIVASNLERKRESIIEEQQIAAAKRIWETLYKKGDNEALIFPEAMLEKIEDEFIRYWIKNGMHHILMALIQEYADISVTFSKMKQDENAPIIPN